MVVYDGSVTLIHREALTPGEIDIPTNVSNFKIAIIILNSLKRLGRKNKDRHINFKSL